MTKNFMDFTSDKVDIFILLVDSSGSMAEDASAVSKGLEMYKKSFENFSEVSSIVVSVSKFATDLYLTPFCRVKDIDTSYEASGTTVLNYAIVEGSKYLKKYMQDIIEVKAIIPKATFIVFSDGEPMKDYATTGEAKSAIENLNESGVTTVFVAFGKSIVAAYGKKMGFKSTIDVNNRNTVIEFLGVELSKSCKKQSKSLKGLGENFFSKAASEQSTEYSSKTAQVLEDEDWMDDL